MNAIDTNVLLYAVDEFEPTKQQRAVSLLDRLVRSGEETVLLWQVAGEYLNGLRRWSFSGKIQAGDVEPHFQNALTMFPLAIPTEGVFRFACQLVTRHSLSHWDSMLLGACVVAGVDTLYSEDMGADETYEGVTIRNPFV